MGINDRHFDSPWEEAFAEMMYTTPDERDPTKPFVVCADDMVELNPDYDGVAMQQRANEADRERRRTKCGTTFFTNFDPTCNVHQIDGPVGHQIREKLKVDLAERFMQIFLRVCYDVSGKEAPAASLEHCLRVNLYPYAAPGFNNGEIYFWLRGLPLKEEFVTQILLAFKKSLEESPVEIEYQGEKYEALFYRWGFGYY